MWDWLSSAGSFLGDIFSKDKLSELFSPSNIVSGLTTFGALSQEQHKEDLAAETAQRSLEQQLALERLKQSGAMDLARLEASLAYHAPTPDYSGIERFKGIMQQSQNRTEQVNNATSNRILALKALMEGAQSPLTR